MAAAGTAATNDVPEEAAAVSPERWQAREPAESSALAGPVDDATYVVGPGDVFSITVWGQNVVSHRATVSPEGELVIPGVATVAVAGRLLRDTKADVARSLESFYRDVEVSVSLVGLRNILVNVLGGVIDPGTYVGTALDPAGDLEGRNRHRDPGKGGKQLGIGFIDVDRQVAAEQLWWGPQSPGRPSDRASHLELDLSQVETRAIDRDATGQ